MSDGDEEDERELRRQDLAGPERARFRRQQKEVTSIDRDPETGLIRKFITETAPPEGASPVLSPPLGFDPEAFYRGKREALLERKRAEVAEPPTDAGREGRVAFRKSVLAAGRLLAARIRERKERQKLSKTSVGYGYAAPTQQVAKLGEPATACGVCRNYQPSAERDGVGSCRIVGG